MSIIKILERLKRAYPLNFKVDLDLIKAQYAKHSEDAFYKAQGSVIDKVGTKSVSFKNMGSVEF